MSPKFRVLRRLRRERHDGKALKVPFATEKNGAIQAYLAQITGSSDPTKAIDASHATSYILYIKEQSKWIPGSLFTASKGTTLPSNSLATIVQIFGALTELAAGMKASPQWSIDDGINSLAVAGIIRTDLSGEDVIAVSQLVFAMSGWITMLFTPLTSSPNPKQKLQVDITGTRRFLTSFQPVAKAERPLLELLKGFGEILPIRRQNTLHLDIRDAGSSKLEVSNLNVATLINIGRINIVWVRSISSHLEFDSLNQRLSLFCLPSFCMLNIHDKTPSESVLNDFYDDDISRGNGVGHPLFNEILLSYKLLFADDRQARSIFRKRERKRAEIARGTPFEPCLDKLCGMNARQKSYLSTFRTPFTVSYSKDTDFPFLADRLSELQSYITAQQPNKLSALWHDRRNLLSWYTFWAVLIFGVVGITCSIIQTGLVVVQTVIAWKAYQAQLASIPSPTPGV